MSKAQKIKAENAKFFDALDAAAQEAKEIRGTSTGGRFTFDDGSALELSCPYVEVVA